MHRLSRADLANLWAEGRYTPSHIALIGEFEAGPLCDAAGRLDVARVRAELAGRAGRIPALARRILWTRFGEGGPVWASDPTFVPADHIGTATLPAGTAFPAWCADRIGQPLPPNRPPWRAEIVDGLPEHRFGLLMVLHHVVADGLTAVAIAEQLLDRGPHAAAPSWPTRDVRAPLPTHRILVRDNIRRRLHALTSVLRGLSHTPTVTRHAVRQCLDAFGDLCLTAPRTSLPGHVGPRRRLAVLRFPLAELHSTAHALDATINDILLAAVAGGLRELFLARGEKVDGLTMTASMPAGAHSGRPQGMLLLGLPVSEPDPRLRLAAITATTTRLKSRLRTGGSNVFDVLHLPMPLARIAVRWMRERAARHINLFVTNVPGPRQPLWLAGARMLDAVPVAPLAADVPLGIAVLSYAGTLAVAVNADAEVHDLDVLAAGIANGVAALTADPAQSISPGRSRPVDHRLRSRTSRGPRPA